MDMLQNVAEVVGSTSSERVCVLSGAGFFSAKRRCHIPDEPHVHIHARAGT